MARTPEVSKSLLLSVLDQAPISEGSSGGDALSHSVDLARLAEQLGYHRYWVAEHHGTPGLACTSPEILMALIAASTSRIRVGSGGVMLPHYSPLKVAENFSMLSGLFPGRIDMGIGRAPGTDSATSFALQRDRRQRSPDDFPEQLVELLSFFAVDQPGGSASRGIHILPGRPNAPEPWLLGSSLQSAIWAAELGLPYAFADFINSEGLAVAARYVKEFKPSSRLDKPRLAVAGWAVCADTDEQAEDLASSFRMLITLLHRRQLIAVPSVETAKRFLAQQNSSADMLGLHRRLIVGSPARVRAGIESLAGEYGAEEVLLVNIMHDPVARRRSYELIAHEFAMDHST